MRLLFVCFTVLGIVGPIWAQKSGEGVEIGFRSGGNEILFLSGKQLMAVNSAEYYNSFAKSITYPGFKADVILLTDNRRETIKRAIASSHENTQFIARDASKHYLEGAEEHWQKWWTKRFDYYGQQVTNIPVRNRPINRYLKDGETFSWNGLSITCLALPGYTKDGTGYLVKGGVKNQIIVGGLIYEGGRVPDLYSFQNEIKESKIGNYHGYLGRLSTWIASLRKLKKTMVEHDIPSVVPSYGGLVSAADIDKAILRAQAIYKNYLSTTSLYWYFGEERMSKAAELVLGKDHGVKGMPLVEHIDLPDWCEHIGTTKLIKSESGRAFVLDVGGRTSFEALFKYLSTGLVKGYDGIFVTHTHNDHSAFVADAQAEFECPVYSIKEVCDVMSAPSKYHLPGLPNKPIDKMIAMKDGQKMQWQEFMFTFRYFPGQMYYHAALLVEKAGEEPVFFIGDSFSPRGMDDYCMMNQNLMDDESGYFRCFKIVESLPGETWLVNQHINHRFRFSKTELDFLKTQYHKRRELIKEFSASGLGGIDEQKIWFYPYGQIAKPGQRVATQLKIPFDELWHDYRIKVSGTESLIPEKEEYEVIITESLITERPSFITVEVAFKVSEDAPLNQTEVYTAHLPGLFGRSVEGLVRIEK